MDQIHWRATPLVNSAPLWAARTGNVWNVNFATSGAAAGSDATTHSSARERVISLGSMCLFDIGASLLLFNVARGQGVGEVQAYLLSMLGPLISIAIEFVRHRKLSMFSVFVLTLQALSVVLALVGSTDPKVLLLKDSGLTGGVGLVFLGSMLFGKPLTYVFGLKFGTDGSPEQAAEWARMWDAYPRFRRVQRLICTVWGLAYLAEALIRVVCVYTLPFDTAYNIGAITPIVVTILVVAWTFAYGARARAEGERRRAAQEGVAQAPLGS